VAEAAKPPKPVRRGHAGADLFRDEIDDELEELTTASNAVIDMVHAGKLDEAERAARDLLVRFPEVHDGYNRLGMVYEARGDHKQAADYYRQVIDFVQSRPDQYEPGFETTFQRLIQKLDPPSTD
jgi:tetratricopeptide (TPR) repeat protein